MQHPRKKSGIDEQRIGDELYLYGPGGETLSVLNTTAMMVWSLCDGAHTVSDMAEVLEDIVDAPARSELERDIRECLDELRTKNLLA